MEDCLRTMLFDQAQYISKDANVSARNFYLVLDICQIASASRYVAYYNFWHAAFEQQTHKMRTDKAGGSSHQGDIHLSHLRQVTE
jgi:hypothetical protein